MSIIEKTNKRGNGRGIQWLRTHVNYDGDVCLIWPFGKDDKGYGTLGHEGKIWKAHRMMCVLVNGEPPSPSHHAAHSCGNGHHGCTHPKHLSWRTPEENQQDTITHGTCRQAGFPRRKLTDEQVAEIRALKGQKNRIELSAQFGVRAETIDRILSGRARSRPPRSTSRRFAPEVRAAMAQRAKAMRAAGKAYDYIAAELGVARLTARSMIRE